MRASFLQLGSTFLQRLLVGALLLGGLLGCGEPQSVECALYVECVQAYEDEFDIPNDEPNSGSNTRAYQADGTCWQNFDSAAVCTTFCADAVTEIQTALEEADATVDECQQ